VRELILVVFSMFSVYGKNLEISKDINVENKSADYALHLMIENGGYFAFIQDFNQRKLDENGVLKSYPKVTIAYKKGTSYEKVLTDLCKQAKWSFKITNKGEIIIFNVITDVENRNEYKYLFKE